MNDNDLFNKLKNINIPEVPNLAKGTSIPLQTGKLEEEIKSAKEEQIRKEGYRHNWKVAVFSSLFGSISGFLASLLFWFIEHRFLS